MPVKYKLYFSENVSAAEWKVMFEVCHSNCRLEEYCGDDSRMCKCPHTGTQYAAQTKTLEIGIHTRTHTNTNNTRSHTLKNDCDIINLCLFAVQLTASIQVNYNIPV